MMLERRDEGAVEGLSPRRREVLPWWGTGRPAAGLEEPRWFPGGLLTRLGLEMGTTRLMVWFSEVVRVRTALVGVVVLAGVLVLVVVLVLATAGLVFEVGRFLAGGLDGLSGSTFPSVDSGSPVVCSGSPSRSSLVGPSATSS